jgi:hypothetical protein
MAAQWRTGSLRREDAEQLAAEIIAKYEAERNRISTYLTAAETALSDRRVDVETKP